MARLKKQASQQRDQFETAHVMLGAAQIHLEHMQLRMGQARERHGLDELIGPALDESVKARRALQQVSETLNKINAGFAGSA